MTRIMLALQGGGSHGAFSWGILDRLLEESDLIIEGISGASAGAMNAVVLAHGYTQDGRAGARLALKIFWETIAQQFPLRFLPEDPGYSTPKLGQNTPQLLKMLVWLTRFFSPYQLNPLDLNPLRTVLAEQIDFSALQTHCPIALFIAATSVRTGTLKVFRNADLTLEALLASACLPTLHHAIQIEGEAYWDGGFSANPPLHPLIMHCSSRDLLLVMLQPMQRPGLPTGASEIHQRLTEIGFNAGVMRELQSLALFKQQSSGRHFFLGPMERRLRHLHLHLLNAEELMSTLSTLSKLNAHPAFIQALFVEGRKCAEAWLNQHMHQLGKQSTFPLDVLLQGV